MNAAYRPQEHAAALTDWTALLLHQAREIAALRGDVTRLLNRQTKGVEPAIDPALDDLVRAAFAAMGLTTWITAELVARTLQNDHAALQLAQAIAATGKDSPRALGKYLAARATGAGYLTAEGLEIRRSGVCGNVVAWTIAQV